ncbi:hypothetical protein DBR06_SOUSAS18710025, partial [Sousa chinensis]
VFPSLEVLLIGTSLAVQWLRLRAPNAGDPGLIPGQGTRSRILQPRSHMSQLR